MKHISIQKFINRIGKCLNKKFVNCIKTNNRSYPDQADVTSLKAGNWPHLIHHYLKFFLFAFNPNKCLTLSIYVLDVYQSVTSCFINILYYEANKIINNLITGNILQLNCTQLYDQAWF